MTKNTINMLLYYMLFNYYLPVINAVVSLVKYEMWALLGDKIILLL